MRPLDGDVKTLRLVGQTTVWEYAERVGCSEQVARIRLNRLVGEGMAEKFRGPRGTLGYTYVLTAPAAAKLVSGRRKRERVA
jgi:predicted transcriptional regulator